MATPRLSRNSTSFMHLLSERLEGAEYEGLYPHQARVIKYLTDPSMRSGNPQIDGRGLLVTHQMGTGKGIVMAAAIDRLKMPTVILSTRPLLEAAVGSVGVYEKVSSRRFDWTRVRSASMNASNTMLQVARAVDSVLNPDLQELRAVSARARVAAAVSVEEREQLREAALNVGNTVSLDGVLLVVDEAHLLARAVSNGSKNATAIYRAIQRSPRARVVLFTGTPGVDDPFELGLLFNMVGPSGAPPFPETHQDFTRYFVDRTNMKALNAAKWMNRISGLQSHHLADKQDLPRALEPKLHFIEMGPEQYEEYLHAREKELEENAENSSGDRHAPVLQRPQSKGTSTYRVRSRTAGDSVRAGDDYISAKARKVVDIAESASRVVVVYTQFIERGERAIVAECARRGWSELGASKGKFRYTSINGSVPSDAQTQILKVVNAKSNERGSECKLVIVSVVAVVGLSFIWGSDLIIFESYWNDGLHDQVEARIRRVTSLPGVPAGQRHTQLHFLFAVPPKKSRVSIQAAREAFKRPCIYEGDALDAFLQYSDGFGVPTDISLYLTAKTSARLMKKFRALGERAAIEAVIEKRPEARLCKPTGEPLFISDIHRDMLEPDPCQTFERTKVRAKKIKIDGREYFYSENKESPLGVDLFQKNPAGGYVSVLESDPVFARFFEVR